MESSRISSNVDCLEESVIPPEISIHGDLYSCIGGGAETVKIYINKMPSSSDVENIKIIWDEWTRDVGYGIGVDRNLAESWISAVADLYFSDQKQIIVDAFFGDEDYQVTTDLYVIEYKYHRGPAIDEHLVIITPHDVIQERGDEVAESASDFGTCRDLVANIVDYAPESVIGEGSLVQNDGFISFMLKGENNDIFFCELYVDDVYRIKAAIGGSFPFRYIDEGTVLR